MKKIILFTLSLLAISSITLAMPQKHSVNSESPTDVKNTLSNSQLSYFARIGTGTTFGDSIVKINTAANPSRTTNNLFEGDVVCIGGTSVGQGCATFDVKDIGNTAYFQISSNLPLINAVVGNYIIATRSAQHTVTFTPETNIAGGRWQVLLRATSTNPENNQDGMPDQNGFDIGSNVGTQTTGVGARLRSNDVTCPWSMTVSGIGTTVGVIASNGTTYYYHTIVCSLAAGATNPIGSSGTITVGGASAANSSQIINPAPNHTAANEGVADVYNFFIRHTDSSGTVIDGDTARGQIALVESVRVTATVDPSISFVIDNVGTTNSGIANTVCPGQTSMTNAARVTATQVPFGSLQLSAFNDLAQRVGAITNARSGYVVTVYEDAPLTMIGGSITIPDTTCNGGGDTCSRTTAKTWSNASTTPSKFGYSLTAVPGATPGVMAFNTTDGTGNYYKAFGQGASQAETIFSRTTTPADWERAYVCYRISVTTSQPAGNYENKLVYTATATF
jgi:hypothetical protein